jgi:hypothetical protein
MPFVIHISIVLDRWLIARAATYHAVEPMTDTNTSNIVRHLESEERFLMFCNFALLTRPRNNIRRLQRMPPKRVHYKHPFVLHHGLQSTT